MDKLTLIAAIGKNGELGKDNTLIWKFKEDMKFFKENTMGKPIVMGRKTLESLPRLLPNRTHIVLTRQELEIPGVLVLHHKEELLDFVKHYQKEVMIIGGASIYQLFIEDADKMLLTEINDTCDEADVYFPKFDRQDWNKNILSSQEENGIQFCHVEYTRKLIR